MRNNLIFDNSRSVGRALASQSSERNEGAMEGMGKTMSKLVDGNSMSSAKHRSLENLRKMAEKSKK